MKMKVVFALVAILVSMGVTAQRGVSGVFTYKASISRPDTNLVMRSWKVKVFTNDTVVRVESETNALGNQVFIRHMELNKAYLLLQLDGNKFAIQTDLAENRNKADSSAPAYTFRKKLFGGKRVAGIKAKRYYILDNGQKEGYYCWFAKKIPNRYLEVYQDIPGLAVDYYLPSQDGLIHYELESFEEGAVNRDLFGVPSDYKRVTFDEFVRNYTSG